MRRIFKGKLVSGIFIPNDGNLYTNHIISMDGESVEVTITKPIKRRSKHQNSYYWGVVLKIIGEYLGLEAEDVHDAFKTLFSIKTTSKMTTDEFERHIERVVRFSCSELGCYIPEIDECEEVKIK